MRIAPQLMVHAKRSASALAILATACAIGSLLLTAGLAYAWLTDESRVSNELSIALADRSMQEPYAALYASPDSTGSTLVFGRGDEVPTAAGDMRLISVWRGMENGTADFAREGWRPWDEYAADIHEITCDEAAKLNPIRVLETQSWFKDMHSLKRAEVGGITPNALAEKPRWNSFALVDVFAGCSDLEYINGIERWDTRGIEAMERIFTSCTALRSLDLSGWDVSSVRRIPGQFYGLSSLEEIDITGWHLDQCSDLVELFGECRSLKRIRGLETLRCPCATNIAGMFDSCVSLTSIDLSGFGMTTDWSLTTREMFKGCSALRYLDLSGLIVAPRGWYTAEMFPSPNSLETLILSNRFHPGNAPTPFPAASPSPNVRVLGYWISDETGQKYGQQGLVDHLEAIYANVGPFAIERFRLGGGDWDPDDAYAAVYQKQDGSCALVMNTGSSAPPTLDGMELLLEIRDVLIDGERAADAWSSYRITEASICTALAPESCKGWFRSQSDLTAITGLPLLDMSKCADISEMFRGTGVQRLDVEDWNLSHGVRGLEWAFSECRNLRELDLGRWQATGSLEIYGDHALNTLTLPSCIQLSQMEQTGVVADALYFDGAWYENGYGAPLTSKEVCARVNAAYGSDSAPLMFTHEKADRAYGALYQAAGGHTLVFGRGLEVPTTSGYGTLITAYRGIEEQDLPHLPWVEFREDDCPWSAYAPTITSVIGDSSLMGSPIRPTSMERWFREMGGVAHLSALETGAVDASRVKTANLLFAHCTSLEAIPASFIASFTSALQTTEAMYAGCSSLTHIPAFAPGAASRVTNAYRMFENCSALTTLDLSSWDFSSVRMCSVMFSGCSQLVTLKLPNAFVQPTRPDALQLTFDHCSNLREIDGSDWDLSGSYTLFRTFSSCWSLERIIGAESWNTARVSTMEATFRSCSRLKLDCSGWDISAVEDAAEFSYGAPGVVSPFEAALTLAEDLIDEEALAVDPVQSEAAASNEEAPEPSLEDDGSPEPQPAAADDESEPETPDVPSISDEEMPEEPERADEC